jgi:hypothetical protein
VHSLNIFGVKMSHGQIQTHKTHHSPNLKEATTFPLTVYSVPLHEAHIQMAFCPGLPNGNPEIPKVGTIATLGPHNFVCKPPIEMKIEAKL